MPYRAAVSFVATFLALFPVATIRAQSGDFAVSQNGHPVGSASFQLSPLASGFESTSSVSIQMQGLDYALSKTEQLDQAHHLKHVLLSGTVNGSAANVIGKPDGTQFLLNISANGRATTTRLEAHEGAVFLPDFDPGALGTLLTLAAAQGNREIWAIIPKQAGTTQPVQIATYSDEQGALDSKPVVVHHQVATIAGTPTELFSGPENQLLQAELPQQGFALVRKGFVLTPPKKPAVPSE